MHFSCSIFLLIITAAVSGQSYSAVAFETPGRNLRGDGYVAAGQSGLWTISDRINTQGCGYYDKRLQFRNWAGQVLFESSPPNCSSGPSQVTSYLFYAASGIAVAGDTVYVASTHYDGLVLGREDGTFSVTPSGLLPFGGTGVTVLLSPDNDGVVVAWESATQTRFRRVNRFGQVSYVADLSKSQFPFPKHLVVSALGEIHALHSDGIYRVQNNGLASADLVGIGILWGSTAWGPFWFDGATGALRFFVDSTSLTSNTYAWREVAFTSNGGLQFGALETTSAAGLLGAPFFGKLDFFAASSGPRIVYGNGRRSSTNDYQRLFGPFVNSPGNAPGIAVGPNSTYYYVGGNVVARYTDAPAPASVTGLGGGFSITSFNPSLSLAAATLGTIQPLSMTSGSPGMIGVFLMNVGAPSPLQLGALTIHVDPPTAMTLGQYVTDGTGSATLWWGLPPADPSLANIPLTIQAGQYGPGGAFEITNGVRAVLGF